MASGPGVREGAWRESLRDRTVVSVCWEAGINRSPLDVLSLLKAHP